LEGTPTFETKARPGAEPETHEVRPGEFIHFEPGGVYQTGGNRSDEPVVALGVGVGAPRHEWTENQALFDCAACGEETIHDVVADDPDDERLPDPEEMSLVCTDCGTVIEVE
jgi:predicted RNA-binding Zn-ribbon protein involved in translation (DUF1610 family)